MNRFWARTLRKSDLPLWYTEGYNPHIYTKFAMPLSLGFESECEYLDIRILDDSYPIETIKDKLNSICPPIIRVSKVFEPTVDFGDITFAEYEILLKNEDIVSELTDFLNSDSIMLSKKTKRGNITEFDVIPEIKKLSVSGFDEIITVNITLPAGSQKNINPVLIFNEFEKRIGIHCILNIKRIAFFDADFGDFDR